MAALCGRRLLLCVYHLLFALKRLQQASTHAAINAFIAIRWCIAVYLAGYNVCLALQEWAEFVIPLSALNGSLVTPWQMIVIPLLLLLMLTSSLWCSPWYIGCQTITGSLDADDRIRISVYDYDFGMWDVTGVCPYGRFEQFSKCVHDMVWLQNLKQFCICSKCPMHTWLAGGHDLIGHVTVSFGIVRDSRTKCMSTFVCTCFVTWKRFR